MKKIKKRKGGLYYIGIGLWMLIFASLPAYAAEASGKTEEGTEISLSVQTEAAGSRLQPGEFVPYLLTLENKKGPAWVRVQLSVKNDGGLSGLTPEIFAGIPEDAVRKGDYIYWKKPLAKGEKAQLCRGFLLPDYELVEKDTELWIKAVPEAVQDTGKQPDFGKKEPWEDLLSDGSSSGGSGTGGSHESAGGGGTGSGPHGGGSSSGGPGAAGTIYRNPDESAKSALMDGSWELLNAENKQWIYKDRDGKRIRDGWIYLHNPYAEDAAKKDAWFCFDKEGIMRYGWYQSENGFWYHLNSLSDGTLGMMQESWYLEPEDQRYYYLEPGSGKMLTGWQEIDGSLYYFATLDDIPEQTWYYEAFDRTLGDTGFGRWVYRRLGVRSYGSMYAGGKTPDGSSVDAAGRKTASKEGKKGEDSR